MGTDDGRQRPADGTPRRAGLVAGTVLAGAMAGHAFLETARDAMFLSELPAKDLPWVYLAIAVAALALSRAHGVLGQVTSPRVLGGLLSAAAAGTWALWWAASASTGPAILYGLYVWTGVYATVVVTQFWLVVSQSYTIIQAKRVYASIGAGGVAGAIVGALLARVIVEGHEPRSLILVAAMTLALTAVLAFAAFGRARVADAAGAPAPLAPRRLRRSTRRYLIGVAALVALGSATTTSADYLFKTSVSQHVAAEDMASFFATFHLLLNVAAMAVQVLLLPWLLSIAAISRTLLVLPALLLGGSVGWAFAPGLVAGLFLASANGALRHTLHQTAVELHFVPVPESIRDRVKAWIDSLAKRGGQAGASLVMLAVAAAALPLWVLGAVTGVASLVWLYTCWRLRSRYLEMFRSKLSGGASMPPGSHLPALDMASLEALLRGLNSGDDAVVLAALEMLEDEDELELVPALILYHPSPAVVLDAMARFERAGRRDTFVMLRRLQAHAHWQLRAAATRSLIELASDEEPLREALADPHPAVRATALVHEVLAGRREPTALEPLIDVSDPDARRAMAQMLARHSSVRVVPLLLRLGRAPEVDVREQTARAMQHVLRPEMFPSLLHMLGEHRSRIAARETLRKGGDAALDFLAERLSDERLPHVIRRHIPRTLSRFESSKAARVLLDRMLEEQDGMIRFKILRALGKLHSQDPNLELDPGKLDRAIQLTVSRIHQELRWLAALEEGQRTSPAYHTEGGDLLVERLQDKAAKATGRLLRLVGLRSSSEDLGRIAWALDHERAELRAGARELLGNLLDPPLRATMLALVEPGKSVTKLADGFDETELLEYPRALAGLLDDSSASLSALAAYHAAELSLHALAPKLQELATHGSTWVREAAAAAQDRLREPERRSTA